MKVLASDYDGTLYKDKKISAEDLQAIKDFREKGNQFGIVTGRTVHSILFEIRKHKIPVDFVIGINGGIVLNQEQKEVYASKMAEDVIDKLTQALADMDVLFYGVNDGYRMGRVSVLKEDQETEFNIPLTPLSELKKSGVKAFYVRCKDRQHAKKIADKINDRFKKAGVKAYPNNWSVDIGVQGVSKASGMNYLLDDMQISKEQVFTVGDAYNDVSMLKEFNGFIMENAFDELKNNGWPVVNRVYEVIQQII